MNRLASTMRLDVRLQFRNGFYYASIFVAVIFVLVMLQISNVDLSLSLPALIMLGLVVNTYYFMSGLVLLEKAEGTLEALIVTPLRTDEYLISKVATLAGLSLFEWLIIIILTYGLGFNWPLLLVGTLVMVAMYALYGFIIVSRYDSINEFLLPSVLWTMGLSLPLIDYFGLWQSWIFYLHPLQAPLLLLRAAFGPVEAWQIVYGLLYGALWVGIVYWLSQRAFYRFVIVKEGTR